MWHSSTEASTFKLQPAPKSRKRPQNPPAVSFVPATSCSSDLKRRSNSSTSRAQSCADSASLRSCFEDEDEALTPKASHFNSALLEPKEGVFNTGTQRSSSCSPVQVRDTTASVASLVSTQSSSTVARLLAAMSMSTSPRRSSKDASLSSPSASVAVVLSNKAVTPCSPMFPRRSLMRRLSSTCVSAAAISPSSPLCRSPSAALCKRMGWRGIRSAQMHDETAILLSPGSPLTPRRAEMLHTPTQTCTAPVLNTDQLAPHNADEQVEPLSATLRALGAKRHTERFASTCIPLQSPSEADAFFDELGQVKSPNSEAEFGANHDDFELMTATRKIFHLPTWVRFEANHHRRARIADENRKAVAEFSELEIVSRNSCTVLEVEGESVTPSKALPKLSHLGDVAPDSPNGELLAGFEIESPTDMARKVGGDEGEWVVSVLRRPNMAALRQRDPVEGGSKLGGGGRKVLGAIRCAWPSTNPWHRIKASHPTNAHPRCQSEVAPNGSWDEKERRDGWGGVLTRTSWFPSHTKGPLVSPPPPSRGKKNKGLKALLLPSSAHSTPPIKPTRDNASDEEWEDIDACSILPNSSEPLPFLEQHDKPHFFHREPAIKGWFQCATKTKDRKAETTLNIWQTHPPQRSNTDGVVSSKVINRGTKSIENQPIRTCKRQTLTLGVRVAIIAVTAILVVASVAYAVTRSRTHSAAHSLQHSGTANAGLPPLNNSSPGPTIALPPFTAGKGSAEARESSVAKAADMSQPWFKVS